MADKRPGLADAIRAAVPPVVRRAVCWWEKLDAETLAELEAIRADFRSGRLGQSKSAVAAAVVAELSSRGLSDIGKQGVTTWLGAE